MRTFKVLTVLSLVALLSGGCAMFLPPQVVLHPIDKADIYVVKAGQQVGSSVVDRDGFFISKEYMELVLKARVNK